MDENEHSNLLAQCEELQADELTVLDSIYPDQTVVYPNPHDKPGKVLTLTLPIVLPEATPTLFPPSVASFNAAGPSTSSLTLSHLPPLILQLQLPSLYPLLLPPRVMNLKAPVPELSGETRTSWLPKRLSKSIEAKLTQMWEDEKEIMGEGQGILWKWWEWVVNGEFLSDLSLLKDGALQLSVPPIITPSAFFAALKLYNASKLHSEFEKTAYSCSICWENRKGNRCVQMPGCGCIFCVQCLKDCWTLAISEGTVDAVGCPSASCVKSRATRDATETLDDQTNGEFVESIVGPQLRQRWDTLKEKRKVEIDTSYCICPRPKCEAAVPPPPLPPTTSLPSVLPSKKVLRLAEISSTSSAPPDTFTSPAPPPASSEDRWAAYRLCPKCNFSFCLYCSSTWHGPHTVCALPQTSTLVLEYLGHPEGSEGRALMERRRGKTNLEKMVAKWREDEMNKQWMEQMTRACAGCGVRVEKSHGCNHMTCNRCNSHFCYRCGESIKPSDPYKHFNTEGRPCYQKLFDLDENGGQINIIDPVLGIATEERELADENWRELRGGVWEWW